ncbi:hypothetical protein AALB_2828 [Agarivorans albus MKT 106]|uniref:O-antigen polymerase n=1 Tax=Agarivorans albus MKT 106 TaxID=1331007 RepID=R9PN88_AGAAL|nr:hypothetical protein AALB_2828 [Agarivorans albus MKT 106]
MIYANKIYIYSEYCFFLLFLFSFILPPLFPKKIFFALSLVLLFLGFLYRGRLSVPYINPLIFVLFFYIYWCMYPLGNVDFDVSTQFFLSTLMLFLFYSVVHFRLDVNIHFKYAGFLLAFIALYASVGFFGFILNLPFSSELIDFYIFHSLGFLGERNFGVIVLPMFHFVSTPVLLVLLSLVVINSHGAINASRMLVVFGLLSVIFLSGSRAIFLTAFATTFMLYYFYASRGFRFFLLLFFVFLFYLFF